MAGSYLVYSCLGGMFVSWLPCSVFCLFLVTVRIVYGPYHMAGGNPGSDSGQRYSWLVCALLSHVLAAYSLLCYPGVVGELFIV